MIPPKATAKALETADYESKTPTLWCREWKIGRTQRHAHVMISFACQPPTVFAAQDGGGEEAANEEKRQLIKAFGFEDGDKP